MENNYQAHKTVFLIYRNHPSMQRRPSTRLLLDHLLVSIAIRSRPVGSLYRGLQQRGARLSQAAASLEVIQGFVPAVQRLRTETPSSSSTHHPTARTWTERQTCIVIFTTKQAPGSALRGWGGLCSRFWNEKISAILSRSEKQITTATQPTTHGTTVEKRILRAGEGVAIP